MNPVDGTEITIDEADGHPAVASQQNSQERSSIVRRVAEETNRQVRENLQRATTELDYLRWSGALVHSTTPEMIDWMWDYGGISVEDLLAEYQDPKRESQFNQEVNYLLELKGKLSRYPNRKGMVKVALKRIRVSIDKYVFYRYRVLAEFPVGYYVRPSDYEWPEDRNMTQPHVIYFEPENACVVHPCDDLFKASRQVHDGYYMTGKDD